MARLSAAGSLLRAACLVCYLGQAASMNKMIKASRFSIAGFHSLTEQDRKTYWVSLAVPNRG